MAPDQGHWTIAEDRGEFLVARRNAIGWIEDHMGSGNRNAGYRLRCGIGRPPILSLHTSIDFPPPARTSQQKHLKRDSPRSGERAYRQARPEMTASNKTAGDGSRREPFAVHRLVRARGDESHG